MDVYTRLDTLQALHILSVVDKMEIRITWWAVAQTDGAKMWTMEAIGTTMALIGTHAGFTRSGPFWFI